MGWLEDKEVFFMDSEQISDISGQLWSAASDETLDTCHSPLVNGISYGFVEWGLHSHYSPVELLEEHVL